MPGRSLSERQKRAARTARGENPRPAQTAKQVLAPIGMASGTGSSSASSQPAIDPDIGAISEEDMLPTEGRLKKVAGSNKRKTIIVLIILRIALLIFTGILLAGAHTAKTIDDSVIKNAIDGPSDSTVPPRQAPQSHFLPAIRDFVARAGCFFTNG